LFLQNLTITTDFIAFSLTLWLAFYLLGRGFPGPVTMRAVIVLFALSAFFFNAYTNIFNQIVGSASIRAAMLMIALSAWYSLTVQLLPAQRHKAKLPMLAIIHLATLLVSMALISNKDSFLAEQGNSIWVAHMKVSPIFGTYGLFQVAASGAILFNLLSLPRTGQHMQGKYFLLASLMPISAVSFGIAGLGFSTPLPRVIQDGLLLSGVLILGLSIARHQTMVERRTTLQDFPLSMFSVLGLSGLYVLIAAYLQKSPLFLGGIMLLAISTHCLLDLAREYLERKRSKVNTQLHQQVRHLENLEAPTKAPGELFQAALVLLCENIGTDSAWVATRQADGYQVTASYQALAIGSLLPGQPFSTPDLLQLDDSAYPECAWIAPALAGTRQVAVVGIAHPRRKLGYTPDDLDLLSDVTDKIGSILAIKDSLPATQDQLNQLQLETSARTDQLRLKQDALMTSLAGSPNQELVSTLEEALRHLQDYITLGQSPLARQMKITGKNHVERGRNLHDQLIQMIESLHPGGARPGDPIPREWYNYVVLYDAYAREIPNREIMNRLYISEGTFNRTRRNALRGLARLVLEKESNDNAIK
jgi:hypothetical protein